MLVGCLRVCALNLRVFVCVMFDMYVLVLCLCVYLFDVCAFLCVSLLPFLCACWISEFCACELVCLLGFLACVCGCVC